MTRTHRAQGGQGEGTPREAAMQRAAARVGDECLSAGLPQSFKQPHDSIPGDTLHLAVQCRWKVRLQWE